VRWSMIHHGPKRMERAGGDLAECEWEEIKPLFDGLSREKVYRIALVSPANPLAFMTETGVAYYRALFDEREEREGRRQAEANQRNSRARGPVGPLRFRHRH
jgi:hypothetical protein